MRHPRSSGVLLHITSLPGAPGIGDLGGGAYRFIDFLEQAGQQVWQMLPLGPPAYGSSPYSCYSAFAGNPLLISPEQLVDDDLLSPDVLHEMQKLRGGSDSRRVDFAAVEAFKRPILVASFKHFQDFASADQRQALDEFCDEQQTWLDDFSLYYALARQHKSFDWTSWPAELAHREPAALESARLKLADEVVFASYLQFLFFKQWNGLKAYANAKNIRLFGDMPIFVAHGSADVWANQDLFVLDDDGYPRVVAGVPPDYFSETGQRWGNPLYDWDALAETGFKWWTDRFRSAFATFDLIRIDHFRGFESYWEIPAASPTAVEGRWVNGPGAAVFHAAQNALGSAFPGGLPIVAEDLGLITDEVHRLRDALELPGMRILQFGYDNIEDNYHRPEAYPEHSVAYTGTHDNDTVLSWYGGRGKSCSADDESNGKEASPTASVPLPDGDNPDGMHWVLIGMVLDSASDTAIIPLQDILGLGTEARMNTPGKADGNWDWRCQLNAFSTENASRLRKLTESSNRIVAKHSLLAQ